MFSSVLHALFVSKRINRVNVHFFNDLDHSALGYYLGVVGEVLAILMGIPMVEVKRKRPKMTIHIRFGLHNRKGYLTYLELK